MGALLQKLLLRVFPDSTDSADSAERRHVTAAVGCCSTITIEEDNADHGKESSEEENDSSYLG